MEVCQTGYYTEDFRTQEVPAGFDFTSYGEFRESLDWPDCSITSWLFISLNSHRHREFCAFKRKKEKKRKEKKMFVRSVSSEPEQLKDRGNICADCIITSVRAFSMRPWHPGALAQTQDNGGLLLHVCVCVCVNNAWMGWGRQRQRNRVVRLKTLPSLSSLILSSRLPPPTDLESPSSLPPHPSITTLSHSLRLAFPPPSSSPSLPCFLLAASIHWALKTKKKNNKKKPPWGAWAWVPGADSTVNKWLFLVSTSTVKIKKKKKTLLIYKFIPSFLTFVLSWAVTNPPARRTIPMVFF